MPNDNVKRVCCGINPLISLSQWFPPLFPSSLPLFLHCILIHSFQICCSMGHLGLVRHRPSSPLPSNSLGKVHVYSEPLQQSTTHSTAPDESTVLAPVLSMCFYNRMELYRSRVLELNASDERGIQVSCTYTSNVLMHNYMCYCVK